MNGGAKEETKKEVQSNKNQLKQKTLIQQK